MTTDESTLGARIKAARTAAKLSRPELAKRVGIAPNSLWRYETDKTAPTTNLARAIARELSVSFDWLAGDETVASPQRPTDPSSPRFEVNLGGHHREQAISVVRAFRSGDAEKAGALADALAYDLQFIPYVHLFCDRREAIARGDSEGALKLGVVLAEAVISATGVGVALHRLDAGGLEYSLALEHEPSGPSELVVTLAHTVLNDALTSDLERELAGEIIRRAREYAERMRPKYQDPVE